MDDKAFTIVVVDDDAGVLKRLERLLKFEGYSDVRLCDRPSGMWTELEACDPSVVILDLLMPESDGYAVLGELHAKRPDIPVIVATAVDDLDSVIRCMKSGAFDYVPKAAESARLLSSIAHAYKIRSLQADNRALKDTLLSDDEKINPAFAHIITRDRKMLGILKYIEVIARSDKPILVTGESGSGKELFAKAVHEASGRSGGLVSVNIAGLDDTMFSDTLFGHKKGAFTGADSERAGLIERAAGGTLFLDEIGDLSMQSQVKLLRLIEDKLYYPLGSDLTRTSQASVVAATNRDLQVACEAGTFRYDLFYRLETHRVRIPPLRDRLGDLPLLVERFVERSSERFGKEDLSVPAELYDLLGTYDFPGNVRELESMVFDAVGRCEGRVLPLNTFKDRLFGDGANRSQSARSQDPGSPASGLYENMQRLPTLRESGEALMAEAMRRAGGNQGVAAGLLGISRPALNKRLKNRDAEE